ncbi:uncharacterized protein CTHT_0019410 [Thermochaetoides thermophila DSM 1495]|uniref:Uncharacterized protein n=1 Tax=Chaetomium thermophilum (strain DSM 1495 / CBS 144.50 / IMI 039719) TaxID=759272 RepID=G0S325_CHATD|nr:hypothetical protein CTHT_0019410 [Thermochaetoides thermophila DSM 1495]EGS22408.1 hypothetical protein CTHT_0019410 [Thermochaetoides thermophila DSM 1495]
MAVDIFGYGFSTREAVYFALGLLLLAFVVHRVQRWLPLRHVPVQDIHQLSEKYGPVIRVAPTQVVVMDSDALYRISGARTEYRKSEWYKIHRILREDDHVSNIRDPELRKDRLKRVMPAYTGRDTEDLEKGFDRAISSFIRLIDRKYACNPGDCVPMDFGEKAHFYTLDAIGEIAYSEPFGILEKDSDIDNIIVTLKSGLPVIVALGYNMNIWGLLQKWPIYLLQPHEGQEVGLGAMIKSVDKVITKRLSLDDKSKRDILQSFIDHGLPLSALRQEVGLQFLAGSDTVASFLRTTFLQLLTNPTAYHALQVELDAFYSSSPSESDISSENIISDAQARTLPYLQAVVREGLRLFPPATSCPFPKVVPHSTISATFSLSSPTITKQGDVIQGVYLPPGTEIDTALGVYGICRDKQFWGADADCFRPERWLQAEKEVKVVAGDAAEDTRFAQMLRKVELVFGSVQYVCAGRSLAYVEMRKVIAELMRRYNWSLVDPLKPPIIVNNGVWETRDFWVRAEKR